MLFPVFAGRNESGELYILYEDKIPEQEFAEIRGLFGMPRELTPPVSYHLQLPDGKRWALNPDTTELVKWLDDSLDYERIRIKSEVWSGELRMSRVDLVEAQILDSTS